MTARAPGGRRAGASALPFAGGGQGDLGGGRVCGVLQQAGDADHPLEAIGRHHDKQQRDVTRWASPGGGGGRRDRCVVAGCALERLSDRLERVAGAVQCGRL